MLIDTSLEAWGNVKATLRKRQKEVYEIIKKYPEHTAAEFATILHKPVNSISGRFTELSNGTEKTRGLYLIKRIDKRRCSKTKGIAWTWRAV